MKVIKQGEDLIGCLCGVSDDSLELAKESSKEFGLVKVIKKVNDFNIYIDEEGIYWNYAYPIPKEKLLKLAENIGRR